MSHKAPAISVVMPVYNGERYLEETLRSLLSQTFTDFELLIIDDGSTDATPDIIERAADARIRYLRNERNMGISYSANRGIEESRGKYMARADADDIHLPHRLAVQWEFMEQHPEIAVCGGLLDMFDAAKGVYPLPEEPEVIKAHLAFYCSLAQPSSFFRKDFLIRNVVRYDQSFIAAGDLDLWYRITHNYGGLLANIPQVLVLYRVHEHSISRTAEGKQSNAASFTRCRHFEEWGIALTDAQRKLHHRICFNQSPLDKETVEAIKNWFILLKKQNEESPRYAPLPWKTVLARKFLMIVQHNLELGPWVCRQLQSYPDIALLELSRKDMQLLMSLSEKALRQKTS